MAGRRLELTIAFSRTGGLALAVVAASVLIVATPSFTANYLLLCALIGGSIQGFVYLMHFQGPWLCLPHLGGEEPGNVKLLVLIAVEWLVACLTIGTACAAITVNQFALQHYYCAADADCVAYLVAAWMACAAGALGAVSALGMLWIRPAQAP